jgi:hypothetical protein
VESKELEVLEELEALEALEELEESESEPTRESAGQGPSQRPFRRSPVRAGALHRPWQRRTCRQRSERPGWQS